MVFLHTNFPRLPQYLFSSQLPMNCVFCCILIILQQKLYLKSTIFWDITSCSPLKVSRRLGGTYRLHLQGQRIIRVKKPT
jgi:hypothetical protein